VLIACSGIIENLGDIRTNQSGMADVRMRWKAANYAYQYPVLICERAMLPLFPSFAQPTKVITNGTQRALWLLTSRSRLTWNRMRTQ
jgi:hypothetical protein